MKNWFFLLALLVPTAETLGASRDWLGTAGNNWSTPANWSPPGLPQDGDELNFVNKVSNNIVNDLPNLTVRSMLFREVFSVTGNALKVMDRIASQTSDGAVIIDVASLTLLGHTELLVLNSRLRMQCPLNLNGFNLTLNAFVNGSQNQTFVSLQNNVFGVGNIISANGDNFLHSFNGTSFFGALRVERHSLDINCFNGIGVNDALEIFPGATVSISQNFDIGPNAAVLIHAGAQLLLQNHTNTFSNIEMRGGVLDAGPRGMINLMGRLTISGDAAESARVAGNIALITDGFVQPPEIHVNSTLITGLNMEAALHATGYKKFGPGSMRLLGTNTYSGITEIWGGVVEARHPSAFGAANDTILNNGGITLRNVLIQSERLLVAGNQPITADTFGALLTSIGFSGWLNDITLSSNLVVNSGDLCILGGPVTGPGGFEFLGSRVQMGGSGSSLEPQTYSGLTRVRCEQLIVSVNNPFAGPIVIGGGFFPPVCEFLYQNNVNNGIRGVTLHPNGLINLNGRDDNYVDLTFNGGRIVTGNAMLTIHDLTANPTNVTALIEGNLNLNSFSPNTVFEIGDGLAYPDVWVNGPMTDTINLNGVIKRGDGELLLSGANSYRGPTTIQGGLIHIQNNTSLGSMAAGTTVQDGGTLQVEFVGALAEPLHIQGAGRYGTLGALNLLPGTGIGAPMVLDGPSTVRVDTAFAILGSTISGTGPLTKVGAGTLQIGGGSGSDNTYTGETRINQGTAVLFKPHGIAAVPGHLVIGSGAIGSTATVRHFTSFTILGSVTVNGGSVWDLNGQAEGFTVSLLEGRPPLTLVSGGDVQTGGSGIFYLPVGGDLVVNPGLFGSGSSVISGNIGLDPGPHRFIVGSSISIFGGPPLDITAAIGEPGGIADLIKEGSGEMRLGGQNSFRGTLAVNGGTVTAAHSGALGTSAGATTVNNGASLALTGNIFVSGEPLILNSTNPAALLNLGFSNTWAGSITLQQTAGVSVAAPGSSLELFAQTSDPQVVGPGGIIKTGPGTLGVTGLGPNTYAGPTVINDGILETRRLQFPTLSRNILVTGNNSVLLTTRSSQLPPDADITVNNGGLWHMFDSGNEQVGSLQGNGRVEIFTSGSITVNAETSHDFAGTLTGAGTLFKAGFETWTLSGTSTAFPGTTVIVGGPLEVNGTLTPGPIQLNNEGVRLQGTGTVGPIELNTFGAQIAPGTSPGILTSGQLSAGFNGGTLEIELNGTTVGAEYDQLNIIGDVFLGPAMELDLAVNFAPALGDQFIIINNDATDAINGRFVGLPSNSAFFADGQMFVINYAGGDGNDVVITRSANVAPVVSIQSPTQSAIVPPGPLPLTATVNDPTSTNPPTAEFFIDDQSVGVDTAAPYQVVWDATPGSHVLRVRATDSFGVSTMSQGRLFFVANPIFDFGADWLYEDNGFDLGTAWRLPGYNDRSWFGGPAQLGFGDGDEATVLQNGSITYYFRKHIQLANENHAIITLLRDDGAIVFINGQEVGRFNLPREPADLPASTRAITNINNPVFGVGEGAIDTFAVPAGALTNGANVLAVEVHQRNITPFNQADISFDLSFSAVPYNPGEVLTIDAVGREATVRWPDYLSDWQLQESIDLKNWTDVPDVTLADGFLLARPPIRPHAFFRLQRR